jgi:CopG family nickel-responsive transcriptional regulator
MSGLERISITIDRDLLERLDRLVERSGGANRSEVLRDLVRARLLEERNDEDVVAASLTVVYEHDKRALADQMVDHAHDHHEIVLATLHVHLDHDHCLEVSALRGPLGVLRHYADHVIGLKASS